jgi:hypothetical protein
MVDPMGCWRYAFTPLAVHIADLPEQDHWSLEGPGISGVGQAIFPQWHPPAILVQLEVCRPFNFPHPRDTTCMP